MTNQLRPLDLAFGQYLRTVRKEKALTIVQVASQSGITPASLSHWENGLCKPQKRSIKRLSQLYDIDLNAKFKELQHQAQHPDHTEANVAQSDKTKRIIDIDQLIHSDTALLHNGKPISTADRNVIMAFISGMTVSAL
ncbi:helix-turn-helix domain-containing protein [Lacticaseibacillus saniviri]|uniref:helix-turn-helix domain-containing protein n=1 Tax=Lacticaseibacillus saniviri TaxID=931533 RepID=UPI0006D1F3E1|nr:helix-turn-helix domain-containing protein [Lacticaseibacillus saniviri]MCG4281316.1 helix-turn-helix domain-containing protein [Lacticaseibacillus saniviri]